MRTLFFVMAVAFVTSCAASPRWAYRPSTDTGHADAPGELAGHAAADYPVPESLPRGDLQLAALGVTKVKLPGRGSRSVRSLHVRMVVHNGDREVWTVETNDQKALIDGLLRARLVSATCDGEVMSLAVLMPGDTRTIDLYYELPPQFVAAAALPAVRLDWRVATPAGVIARQSTAFEPRALLRPRLPVVPVDPRQLAKELEPTRSDDGMPRPGRAEATGWSSWRD